MKDRITETYGVEGVFKLEKDEEQGSIFIMPIGFYKNNPFDLFVKTEHGHHYTLHFTPSDLESVTIALKPLSPAKKQASRWEVSAPYESTLINLIKHMMTNEEPDGYAVIALGNSQRIDKQSSLVFQLMTIYRGDHLEGQVWSVKNSGTEPIDLEPTKLHKHNVLAAMFDRSTLRHNQVATLYLVISHDA